MNKAVCCLCCRPIGFTDCEYCQSNVCLHACVVDADLISCKKVSVWCSNMLTSVLLPARVKLIIIFLTLILAIKVP